MERDLAAVAGKALRATKAYSDNAGHDDGNMQDRRPAERCTGGQHTSSIVVAHADQIGCTFSTEVPNFVPPVSSPFVSPAPTEPEFDDDARELVHLPRLLADAGDSPPLLEAAVEAGVLLIHELVERLGQHQDIPDAYRFFKSLKELKTRSTPPRTVIAVVGNTGAGKSSVINALLDEEELLPTNCLRACTASPTEISYNHSGDPAALYRANVEFITTEDWIYELRVLLSDVLDGNGEVSRECTNPDSDAGVAYAKLKAVYPNKTREMLASGDPCTFANEPAIKAMLGTVRHLQEKSAPELYRGLQQYIDSKEKPTMITSRSSMEFWPLVKVVRIYTKAAALSTGAVIVDLPGLQDSNAARAAVATNYMKACRSLWIVAPITRAVDDKTAQSLLGDSFKRQLKYDGTYSAVTFICSKTDDILVREAARNLGMEEAISDSCYRAEYLKKRGESLNTKLGQLGERKATCFVALDECYSKLDAWADMESRSRDGEMVYAPSGSGEKRKRLGGPVRSRKDRVSLNSDDDTDALVANDGECAHENPQFVNRPHLTRDAISDNLLSLKSKCKRIREIQRQLEQETTETCRMIEETRLEREGLLSEVKAACIKGRNDYSRQAIKLDFAMGIRELDQENAVEEDDETFNPDQDLRDYNQVAQSLPVFCVSSREFQKLRGNLSQDDFDGYRCMTADDTEIPQLQEHTRRLTETSRIRTCRRFLNEFVQLLNSMNLWASNSGIMYTLPGSDKRHEEDHLRILILTLKQGFTEAVKNASEAIELSLKERIYENFNRAIPIGIDSAISICQGWGASKSVGGLCWSTYKATVRRNGVYTGSAGARNFNMDLFDPISRYLATGWERVFQRCLPEILSEFATTSHEHLETFHQAALQRANERFANSASSLMLTSQISTHKLMLTDLPDQIMATVTKPQREANREAVPVIAGAMAHVYGLCAEERGTGSFARMKSAMVEHVETARNTMFSQATATTKERLEAIRGEVEAQLDKTALAILRSVCRDYIAEFVGTGVNRCSKVSPRELELRASVKRVLRDADDAFTLLPKAIVPRTSSSVNRCSRVSPCELELRTGMKRVLRDADDAFTLLPEAMVPQTSSGYQIYMSAQLGAN